eukprot:994170-Amphidinium_carterae.1
MATLEQVQELVTRIQAMEAREAEGLAREQALHGTVQNLTTQLATAQQQTAAPGTGRRYFIHRYRGYDSAWQTRGLRRQRDEVA